jgi:hypothetical protein
VHKRTAYPGEHEALVSQALWDKVHSVLADSPRQRAARTAELERLKEDGSDLNLLGFAEDELGCRRCPTR